MKSKFWAVALTCFLIFCVAPGSALASSICGKITAVGEAPIYRGVACVREVGGNGHAICAQANEEGDYTINAIAPDEYKLYFEEPQGGPEYLVNYWPEKATYDEAEVLQIGSGETMEANGTLVAAGRIEGTLTAEGEVPQFGEICAYKADRISVACDQVVGESGYRIVNLAPGPYTVGFFISGYRTQYSGGVKEFADATPVAVQADASASASADLESNPGISGTVTAQDTGDPIENVRVCVLDAGRGTCVSTDEDGKYDLGIGGGTYSVWFKGDGYATQYYDGADDEAHETTVTVDESLIHGIDAALEDAGSIKGQVSTGDGRETFGNIEVCADRKYRRMHPCRQQRRLRTLELGARLIQGALLPQRLLNPVLR